MFENLMSADARTVSANIAPSPRRPRRALLGGGVAMRVVAIAAAATLAACSEDGDQGPAGPQGPVGPAGPAGPPAPEPVMEVLEEANGSPVRSVDGEENNEQFPDIGSTFERLSRLAPSDYEDLVSSLAGAGRASARLVSNIVIDQAGADIPNTFGTSDMLWQWGQFLDHDLDLTPGGGEAAPIAVPTGDPFFDPTSSGTATIEFNRSVSDPTTGAVLGNPREQITEITAWIDASNVYGSEEERLAVLREGVDSPFLRTNGDGLLPVNTDNFFNDNGPAADPTVLFLAGDVRAK